LDTVNKIIILYHKNKEVDKYLDLDIKRKGQDIRYALNDDKLKALGWEPKKQFNKELKDIVKYYKDKFIW
jgi:dTDP-D-glucose 4,6-dehydratase